MHVRWCDVYVNQPDQSIRVIKQRAEYSFGRVA